MNSWRKECLPTLVFLPGKSHEQRSLASYSPLVTKNWTRLKRLSTHTHAHELQNLCSCSPPSPTKVWENYQEKKNSPKFYLCYWYTVLIILLGLYDHTSFPSSAAATAKSLQSCPTLCNPIDGSPPYCSIPGILQERTLEWVAISFPRLPG